MIESTRRGVILALPIVVFFFQLCVLGQVSCLSESQFSVYRMGMIAGPPPEAGPGAQHTVFTC